MSKQFGQYRPEKPKGLYSSSSADETDDPNAGAHDVGPGLYGMAAALFVIVGTGAFTVMNGGLPEFGGGGSPAGETEKKFVSRVEAECETGWVKEQNNTDQMHCYMVQSSHRLCDQAEKKHFIATVARFEEDWSVFSARLTMSAFDAAAKVNMNAAEIGMATAKMSSEKLSDAERQEQMLKVEELVGKAMEKSNKILSAKRNKIPHYQLADDFAKLAAKGLVKEEDFGWSKPAWVVRGFQQVKDVSPVCKG